MKKMWTKATPSVAMSVAPLSKYWDRPSGVGIGRRSDEDEEDEDGFVEEEEEEADEDWK